MIFRNRQKLRITVHGTRAGEDQIFLFMRIHDLLKRLAKQSCRYCETVQNNTACSIWSSVGILNAAYQMVTDKEKTSTKKANQQNVPVYHVARNARSQT